MCKLLVLGWGRGISWKTLRWEQNRYTHGFQRSRKKYGLLKGNILENSGLENRDTTSVQSCESRRQTISLISKPTFREI